MAETLEELSKMLNDLNRDSQGVGLKMNMDMSNIFVTILYGRVNNNVLLTYYRFKIFS